MENPTKNKSAIYICIASCPTENILLFVYDSDESMEVSKPSININASLPKANSTPIHTCPYVVLFTSKADHSILNK